MKIQRLPFFLAAGLLLVRAGILFTALAFNGWVMLVSVAVVWSSGVRPNAQMWATAAFFVLLPLLFAWVGSRILSDGKFGWFRQIVFLYAVYDSASGFAHVLSSTVLPLNILVPILWAAGAGIWFWANLTSASFTRPKFALAISGLVVAAGGLFSILMAPKVAKSKNFSRILERCTHANPYPCDEHIVIQTQADADAFDAITGKVVIKALTISGGPIPKRLREIEGLEILVLRGVTDKVAPEGDFDKLKSMILELGSNDPGAWAPSSSSITTLTLLLSPGASLDISKYKNLTFLSLEVIKPEATLDLAKAVPGAGSLKRLIVKVLDGRTIPRLMTFIGGLPALEDLRLQNINLDEKFAATNRLRKINLTYVEGIRTLDLKLFPALEDLDIDSSDVSALKLDTGRLEKLIHLRLYNVPLTSISPNILRAPRLKETYVVSTKCIVPTEKPAINVILKANPAIHFKDCGG